MKSPKQNKKEGPAYGYGAEGDVSHFPGWASKSVSPVEALGFKASFETAVPPSVSRLVGRLAVAAQGAVARARRGSYTGRHRAEPGSIAADVRPGGYVGDHRAPGWYAQTSSKERWLSEGSLDDLFQDVEAQELAAQVVEVGSHVTDTTMPRSVAPSYDALNAPTAQLYTLPIHDQERQETPLDIAA